MKIQTFPIIINGLITNIENDMIEIKTYPNNDIIYIDFEYKGLPEDLNIEKIKIIDGDNINKGDNEETKDISLKENDKNLLEDDEINYKEELKHISAALKIRKFVAIGEIGIDLHWDKTTLKDQKDAFRFQIQLAKNLFQKDFFKKFFHFSASI